MKTTHQLARELLELPDVPFVIEGTCRIDGGEFVAQMTEYDPDGTAIIVQYVPPLSMDGFVVVQHRSEIIPWDIGKGVTTNAES